MFSIQLIKSSGQTYVILGRYERDKKSNITAKGCRQNNSALYFEGGIIRPWTCITTKWLRNNAQVKLWNSACWYKNELIVKHVPDPEIVIEGYTYLIIILIILIHTDNREIMCKIRSPIKSCSSLLFYLILILHRPYNPNLLDHQYRFIMWTRYVFIELNTYHAVIWAQKVDRSLNIYEVYFTSYWINARHVCSHLMNFSLWFDNNQHFVWHF